MREIALFVSNKYVYQGYGVHRIIQYLKEQGIRNHGGNVFSFSSIHNMLKSLLYIGIMTSGETHSEVIPELVIIDQDLFEKAQEIRKQRLNALKHKEKHQ